MNDDLISRQAAIFAILECCDSDFASEYEFGYDDGLRKAVHKLKHLPSAQDVVEVVRCKDCKHYWKNWKNDEPDDECAVCLASPKDDAFCSEGERRTDDGA